MSALRKYTARGASALLGIGALLVAFAGTELLAQPPGAGEAQTASGRVKSYTKAPMGDVDGLVLDDGTVIHWPPHLEDRFTAIAAKGDRVKAVGRMETGPEGDTHLEVQTLTNLRTNAAAENDDGPPPPRGPGRRGAGRGGDPERRLRDLENQIEQLRKEVARLRRDR